YASEIHHPVRFPRGAAVDRERLLPVTWRGRDPGPGEAHADRAAVQHLVGQERARAVAKATTHGRIERAERCATVEPPDRPLSGLGVEGFHAGGAIAALRELEHVVVGYPEASQDFPH